MTSFTPAPRKGFPLPARRRGTGWPLVFLSVAVSASAFFASTGLGSFLACHLDSPHSSPCVYRLAKLPFTCSHLSGEDSSVDAHALRDRDPGSISAGQPLLLISLWLRYCAGRAGDATGDLRVAAERLRRVAGNMRRPAGPRGTPSQLAR